LLLTVRNESDRGGSDCSAPFFESQRGFNT